MFKPTHQFCPVCEAVRLVTPTAHAEADASETALRCLDGCDAVWAEDQQKRVRILERGDPESFIG